MNSVFQFICNFKKFHIISFTLPNRTYRFTSFTLFHTELNLLQNLASTKIVGSY